MRPWPPRRLHGVGRLGVTYAAQESSPVPAPPASQPAPKQATIQRLPIWVNADLNSTSFSPAGYVALPAVGSTSTILVFSVPEGHNGVIYEVANVCQSAQFVDGSGQVTWAIQIDDHYARNYNAIVCQLGLTTNPRKLSGPIFIKEGQVISLLATNVSLAVGPGAQVGGLLGGWFYPKDEEPANSWAS